MLKNDTDFLPYHIFTDDLYKDLGSNALSSVIILNHSLYNGERYKQVGLFQDELVKEVKKEDEEKGKISEMVIIKEYVGL